MSGQSSQRTLSDTEDEIDNRSSRKKSRDSREKSGNISRTLSCPENVLSVAKLKPLEIPEITSEIKDLCISKDTKEKS